MLSFVRADHAASIAFGAPRFPPRGACYKLPFLSVRPAAMKILLVEDDRDMSKALSRALEKRVAEQVKAGERKADAPVIFDDTFAFSSSGGPQARHPPGPCRQANFGGNDGCLVS